MWRIRAADGSVATGWYLLPLRLFLGVTFLYAGLQKLANPNFLKSSSPISIHSQLMGASHTSPIGPLLGHLLGHRPG
jgi:thiosulfate dehydrogenase [quinone] large subunit